MLQVQEVTARVELDKTLYIDVSLPPGAVILDICRERPVLNDEVTFYVLGDTTPGVPTLTRRVILVPSDQDIGPRGDLKYIGSALLRSSTVHLFEVP